MEKAKCALWARVSTDGQTTGNQLEALRAFAATRGYPVVREFDLEESAYNGSAKHEGSLYRALDGARRGEFRILLVWALDRLTRQGPESMLRTFREFDVAGCKVVSLQESWTEAPDSVRPLLLSLMGWVAEQESTRRSERTKAGLARVVRAGQKLGRPYGAKDKHPRKRAALAN